MPELSTIDWEDVIDTLEAQKCVLFIGGGLFTANGNTMSSALEEYLEVNKENHPYIRQYNSDGFYLFKKNRYRRKIIESMKDFYNQSFPESEELIKKIAQLPFTMVVTLTPDNILPRTFDTLGLDYSSDFYFKSQKAPQKFEKPSIKNPLIYNLLGNIEEPESLVLTQNDFFDYLGSVFTGNTMNEDLRYELESAERYIFLGLPFEKWYFQLLLRVLSMQSDKLKEIERLALEDLEDNKLHEIYNKEFKIEFVPTNVSDFINTLFEKCDDAGILKKLPKVDDDIASLQQLDSKEIKNLVEKANTKEALLQTKVLIQKSSPKNKQILNELIVLTNRYKLLKQRELRGTIYETNIPVEYNQIAEQLLEIIDKATV